MTPTEITKLIADLENAEEGSRSLDSRIANLQEGSREKQVIDMLDRSGDCWVWTGKLHNRGRAYVSIRGRRFLHHRAVWTILMGEIPDGKILCHHCDNPPCANPAHLYVGTHKDNTRDMFERGRDWQSRNPERISEHGRKMGLKNTLWRGEGNYKAKLTADEARIIYRSKERTNILAKRYSVDRTVIQRIRRGVMWKQATAALRARLQEIET